MAPIPAARSITPHVLTYDAEYETVAASQTAQVMGGAGAIGDVIHGLVISPSATTAGVVTLLDGAISIPIWVGTAAGITDLKPFYVDLRGLVSVSGPWKITTGVGVTVIAIGKFSA